MFQARILAKQKIAERAATRAANTGAAVTPAASRMGTAFPESPIVAQQDQGTSTVRVDTSSSSPHRKVKARPQSPDFTRNDRKETSVSEFLALLSHTTIYRVQCHILYIIQESLRLTIACVILQKLIRGRAVQNVMYESRYRRNELIMELRAADEMERQRREEAEANEYDDVVSVSTRQSALDEHARAQREARIRETVVESAAGGISSNLAYSLVQEKERLDMIEEMRRLAVHAVEERRIREATEAGRRQREQMQIPLGA